MTWNVGNAQPKEEEMKEWLPENPSFDLIVVGTQVRGAPLQSQSPVANMLIVQMCTQ
jgi:hypothetical protein